MYAPLGFTGLGSKHSHCREFQLLAMMRVGALLGGLESVSEIGVPPAQRFRVVDFGGEM